MQREVGSDPQNISDDASSTLDDGTNQSEIGISSVTSRQTSVESDSSSQMRKTSNDRKYV